MVMGGLRPHLYSCRFPVKDRAVVIECEGSDGSVPAVRTINDRPYNF